MRDVAKLRRAIRLNSAFRLNRVAKQGKSNPFERDWQFPRRNYRAYSAPIKKGAFRLQLGQWATNLSVKYRSKQTRISRLGFLIY